MLNRIDKNLILERYAKGKEEALVERYILDGPAQIKDDLGLTDEQWEAVFEHLVFGFDLLGKIVKASPEFFIETYVKYGILHLREVLEVGDRKFDEAWEKLFDLVAVENKALLYHVIEHREEYYQALVTKGADYLKKILQISAEKYEELWLKVLDMMLSNFCAQKFTEMDFDHGLRVFTDMMNKARVHRPLVKNFGISVAN